MKPSDRLQRAHSGAPRAFRWSCLVALTVLCGCAHTIYFQGPTPALSGKSSITTFGNSSGRLSVLIDGKRYTGHWVYVAGGGGVSMATTSAFNGAHMVPATGTAVMLPSGGNGSVFLTAEDGSSLRCVFDYSQMSITGVGVCVDNQGRKYGLQID